MRNMKDYFVSLFSGRKGDSTAKPSIKNRHAQIPQRKSPGRPSYRRKVYERGDIIGSKYEVYSALGMGGFGLVYLAYNRDIRGIVALNTFHAEFLADGKTREAFKKEALLWVDLEEHLFILASRSDDQTTVRLFVIMDYIRSLWTKLHTLMTDCDRIRSNIKR